MAQSEVLVETTRGEIVERYHMGDVAVVDKEGNLLFSVGDPYKVTYMRSAAKPLQALAYVERGGHERFGFSDAEITLTCGSHSGQQMHVDAVRSILRKIGLDESYLQCGTHMPFHRPTAEKLIREGKKSEWVHSNCSGKHAGMLTLSRLLGADEKHYLEVGGPVQQTILETCSEMMEVEPDDVKIGIDGCGAPVFGVGLFSMALGFARFSDPSGLDSARATAIDRISSCVRGNPLMIAGTDAFNSDLLEVLGDRIIAKSGAEGVYCAGLTGKGIGVAVKVADGSDGRGITPVVVEVLKQLGVTTEDDLERLRKYHTPETKNFRGDICGGTRPVFRLRKA